MSVTVLYLGGGALFMGHTVLVCRNPTFEDCSKYIPYLKFRDLFT